MFDIGFWELTVIAVVALLVVGPEELPTLARTTSRWINKVRRFMSDMKDELESEVGRAEELKERIAEESKIADAHRVLSETTRAVSTMQKDLRDVISGDLLKPVPKAERDQIESASLGPESPQAEPPETEFQAPDVQLPELQTPALQTPAAHNPVPQNSEFENPRSESSEPQDSGAQKRTLSDTADREKPSSHGKTS